MQDQNKQQQHNHRGEERGDNSSRNSEQQAEQQHSQDLQTPVRTGQGRKTEQQGLRRPLIPMDGDQLF